MTIQEYLLTQLISECSELIHAITKAQQFGLYSSADSESQTNLDLILKEYHDIVGTMYTLVSEGVIPDVDWPEHIVNKKIKILKYMEVSREKGILK